MGDDGDEHGAGGGGEPGEGRPLLRVERRGPVTRLILDSPHNRNALSARLLSEFAAALEDIGSDPAIRLVVVTGVGTTFCSGADLGERRSAGPGISAHTALPEVLRRIVRLPQPVLARVNGHVRAGGMGLVAACDLAVAPASATFAFSEVRVGVAPAIIAVPALRVMSRRAFARYSLTGETFSAHEARAAGLLTATVDDAELDRWVEGVTASFLLSSPDAITVTKKLFEVVWEQDWDQAMDSATALSSEAFGSADAAEGIGAFLEKRPPVWVKRP
jgi:methylglutaconyl-CoA hydratase